MASKITRVTIKNFKCFSEETFEIGDNVIVAGPNNTGKTTLLQAIAAWHLALTRWRELNNYHRRGGGYEKAPIARQAFYSVPLRTFDMLWHEGHRSYSNLIEITVRIGSVEVPVEIINDSTEQVYVRPAKRADRDWLKNPDNIPRPVFIPAISGLSTEEPVYQQPKIDQLLGQGKAGDVLRNLLVQTNQNQDAWERLCETVKRVFNYELIPPNTTGANIIAEYQPIGAKERYDIASAGSGFRQVLMLLTFLSTRQGSVFLLDEPDAHLHVILQDSIYNELKSAARKSGSQLVIATHSEVVINAAEPKDVCALLGSPRRLADGKEKKSLVLSLRALDNTDIISARYKGQIFYAEGYTDMDILRAWAQVLDHPIKDYLKQPFWKKVVSETRERRPGIKADEHFKALLLAENNLRGVQIIDRDGKEGMPDSKMSHEDKLLTLCWSRYEIESYLIHPDALARFIAKTVGSDTLLANVDELRKEMREHLPGLVVDDPLGEHDHLLNIKARTVILPSILKKAGLINFSHTNYYGIAEMMKPDEIHPEITEKLDAMAKHLGLL